MTSVLSKNFGRTLLALLAGREDKKIYGTVPERLLVFVPGVHLIAAGPARSYIPSGRNVENLSSNHSSKDNLSVRVRDFPLDSPIWDKPHERD